MRGLLLLICAMLAVQTAAAEDQATDIARMESSFLAEVAKFSGRTLHSYLQKCEGTWDCDLILHPCATSCCPEIPIQKEHGQFFFDYLRRFDLKSCGRNMVDSKYAMPQQCYGLKTDCPERASCVSGKCQRLSGATKFVILGRK